MTYVSKYNSLKKQERHKIFTGMEQKAECFKNRFSVNAK